MELSKLAEAIITLEQQRETIIARLNTLLNASVDLPLGAPVSIEEERVTLTLADLYELAVEKRQEIQKQKLAISKMNLMVEMAKQMTYPDPTLGASYFENRAYGRLETYGKDADGLFYATDIESSKGCMVRTPKFIYPRNGCKN